MTPYLGEFLGTALLLLLGNGVVANILLKDTKGHGTGLIVVALAWAMAVFIAVFVSASLGDAHLNPAVTLGFALLGKIGWVKAGGYMLAQLIGAFVGQLLAVASYRDHYRVTEDAPTLLATFSTGPAIPNYVSNLITEGIATFVLVFAVFFITGPTIGETSGSLGALDALPVALVVLGIGLSLGGPTGYAINPARDLGPRIAHEVLPLRHKGPSDWGYAFVPVVGPFVGAVVAAGLYGLI